MPAEAGMDRAQPPHLIRAAGGRWRTWALSASIVANLFLAGVLFGRSLIPGQPAPPPAAAGGVGVGAGLGVKMRSLPPVDRLKFGAVFARHRPEIRAARAEVRLKNEIARATMTAQPYDRPKAEAAFADVRAASTRLQTAMQAALADGMADISPEARAQLAAARTRPPLPPP